MFLLYFSDYSASLITEAMSAICDSTLILVSEAASPMSPRLLCIRLNTCDSSSMRTPPTIA